MVLASLLVISVPSGAATTPLPHSPIGNTYVQPAAGNMFISTAILSAHRSIDMSMYELKDSVVEEDLVHEARHGVRVRVLLNSAYFGRSENAGAARVLSAGGVHVTWAPNNQIFHAKYLVIDNAIVYIGTGNLVSYYYASTRDFWVADRAPGDVSAVEGTLTDDIKASRRAPLAHGGLVWSPDSAPTLERLISEAHHSLMIESEEMNFDGIESSLIAATSRGVHVTLIMNDSTRYLSELTALARHGVYVSLHSSSQLYIHAKVICADCDTSSGRAFVGSENFSTSSLDYNRELGVISSTPGLLRTLESTLVSDAQVGTRLAP